MEAVAAAESSPMCSLIFSFFRLFSVSFFSRARRGLFLEDDANPALF